MINQKEKQTVIIPHSRPTLGPEELRRVTRVFESRHIAQGEMVQRFEQTLAAKLGAEYAVCTSSGTAALHLTLLAMNIGDPDEVIIPSYVCSALLNAVNYVGATPVLADVDPETCNIDPADVKRRLTGRTRAIIVPHLFGLAANLDDLLNLKVPIIEDCAQAIGGSYHHKPLGSFGQAAIFSFYATKMITTGEGGMVVSNSKKFIERTRDLREYDKSADYKIDCSKLLHSLLFPWGAAAYRRSRTYLLSVCRRSRHRHNTLAAKPFSKRCCVRPSCPPSPSHLFERKRISRNRKGLETVHLYSDLSFS
jgi:dTDP-4-amino-4,6-dideoxygalactose transaminase